MPIVETVKTKPTAGARRATLKIIQKLEHDGWLVPPASAKFGTLQEIAEIIDRETTLPTMLKALEGIRGGQYQLDGTPRVDGFGSAPWIVNLCEEALGQARGEP